MRSAALDERLKGAAEFVRQGAVLADIGTDHAHLPIFLLEEGRIDRAVLSDLNRGPLESAGRNAEAHGLLDKVDLVLKDGAVGLEAYGVTDYAICGMGGELIADIVAAAPALRDPAVRLILQPMSRQAHLRREVSSLGFTIRAERYTFAQGKPYVCMMVEYTGEVIKLGEAEAEVGMMPIDGASREYVTYLESKLRAFRKIAEGKRQGGLDSSSEEEIVLAIEKRLSEIKEIVR